MRQSRGIEFGTGVFMLLGIGALLFLTTQTANIDAYGSGEGYEVTARFNHVGTLKVRSPVSISGVTVGRVKSIDFDSVRLEAVVTLRIDSQFDQIPDDSDASVLTAGLLGGQYIGIEPGGSETFLADQSELEFTQSALILEELVGKYLFGGNSEN
ncbi:MAG: outer membrane lipid asymmetry maintenance protein MlaD [Pseudomonadota bacterium]